MDRATGGVQSNLRQQGAVGSSRVLQHAVQQLHLRRGRPKSSDRLRVRRSRHRTKMHYWSVLRDSGLLTGPPGIDRFEIQSRDWRKLVPTSLFVGTDIYGLPDPPGKPPEPPVSPPKMPVLPPPVSPPKIPVLPPA